MERFDFAPDPMGEEHAVFTAMGTSGNGADLRYAVWIAGHGSGIICAPSAIGGSADRVGGAEPDDHGDGQRLGLFARLELSYI